MLIIGIGNLDRGDDGVGILVARHLAERGVDALEHTGPALSLLEVWGTAEQVVLIDAMLSGAVPGTIQIWDVHATTLENGVFRSYTHEFGLAETIELARVLSHLPKTAIIYGIEGANFATGSSPCPEVLTGVDRVVHEIYLRLDHPRPHRVKAAGPRVRAAAAFEGSTSAQGEGLPLIS